MRVLLIDINCKSSSTGQIVYSLFSQCRERGISAAVCYGRGPNIKEPGVYKFGLDIETLFHAFMTRLTGYTGCFSVLSTNRLIRFIEKFKPDIVHIHELHAYFVNIKQLLNYLKSKNIKTVFTNHCEFLYTGKCGHSGECKGYMSRCGKCPKKRVYPASLFFDHTQHMLNEKKIIFNGWNDILLTAPSKWIKDRMMLSFLGNRNITVINNGIDTSIFSVIKSDLRKSLNIPVNNHIVMTAAPSIFSDVKGGYRFIEIAKKLVKTNITCIIVGADKNDRFDSFQNLIVLPLIKDKLLLTQYYSLADCFVICSRNENYPTTSLEAQCCGTKVVGYDVGGVKETILEGNGCVVPFNDSEAAKERILEIVNEGYSKEEVSKKAKEYFSSKRMFLEYLDLYKDLCDSKC